MAFKQGEQTNGWLIKLGYSIDFAGTVHCCTNKELNKIFWIFFRCKILVNAGKYSNSNTWVEIKVPQTIIRWKTVSWHCLFKEQKKWKFNLSFLENLDLDENFLPLAELLDSQVVRSVVGPRHGRPRPLGAGLLQVRVLQNRHKKGRCNPNYYVQK